MNKIVPSIETEIIELYKMLGIDSTTTPTIRTEINQGALQNKLNSDFSNNTEQSQMDLKQ